MYVVYSERHRIKNSVSPHLLFGIAVCRLRMIEAVTINKYEGKSQGCALLEIPCRFGLGAGQKNLTYLLVVMMMIHSFCSAVKESSPTV